MQAFCEVGFDTLIMGSLECMLNPKPNVGMLRNGVLITYEGGSICNENPFITPSTNRVRILSRMPNVDQSVAVKMVHETLFYLSKFNKLHTF